MRKPPCPGGFGKGKIDRVLICGLFCHFQTLHGKEGSGHTRSILPFPNPPWQEGLRAHIPMAYPPCHGGLPMDIEGLDKTERENLFCVTEKKGRRLARRHHPWRYFHSQKPPKK